MSFIQCHGQILIRTQQVTNIHTLLGKTKVLTSRVAYLLLHHRMPPETIIVTTFTKKAANEMKERLKDMLGGHHITADRLLIGTFHSICVKILKRHGSLIGWKKFDVAAERDVEDILDSIRIEGKTLKELRKVEQEQTANPSSQSFRARISSLKSKGLFVEDYLGQREGMDPTLAQIYEAYDAKMKDMKLLDFDDLLLYSHRLLSGHKVLTRLRHVLIDEFQDTNALQLKLMHAMSSQNPREPHNVTVVGDPDQSIYGFRDAEALNFQIMRGEIYHNESLQIVKLSENYRSTQSVLNISETLMTQQADRTLKNLRSQWTHSIPPVLIKAGDMEQEAKFIAHEIKQLRSLPGAPYRYTDMVILLRAAYLSREIERALSQLKIPYSIVKGRAFWERREVTATMDFLRVVNNTNDRVALLRSFKLTSSGIGAASLEKIGQLMEHNYQLNGEIAMTVLRRLKSRNLKIPRVSLAKLEGSIAEYLHVVDSCLKLLKNEGDTLDTALKIFDTITRSKLFSDSIINVDDNSEEKEENVQEVRNFLRDFKNEELDTSLTDADNEPLDPEQVLNAEKDSLLSNFITSVDLYLTESITEDDGIIDKVSISTIHAAKGLEWPIGFVPGLREECFPSKRTVEADDKATALSGTTVTKNLDEDRRVLYVALTRAKHFLYLSSPGAPSRFLSDPVCSLTAHISQHIFRDEFKLELLYAEILHVTVPEKKVLREVVKKYQESYQKEIYNSATKFQVMMDQRQIAKNTRQQDDEESAREFSNNTNSSRASGNYLYGNIASFNQYQNLYQIRYNDCRSTNPPGRTVQFADPESEKEVINLEIGAAAIRKQHVIPKANQQVFAKAAQIRTIQSNNDRFGARTVENRTRFAPKQEQDSKDDTDVLNGVVINKGVKITKNDITGIIEEPKKKIRKTLGIRRGPVGSLKFGQKK